MKKSAVQLLSLLVIVCLSAVGTLAATTQFISNNQFFANWGLDRLDQRNLPRDQGYTYTNTGAGVNVYVMDDGINTAHQEFGGRAVRAYDATLENAVLSNCNDHGTHVAGIIGGSTFGVGKQVNLYSVRIGTCQVQNNGSLAPDYPNQAQVRALDWILLNHQKPAVVNMSFVRDLDEDGDGHIPNYVIVDSIEERIRALIALGVTVVVGAGNKQVDATGRMSPARINEAITVGASNANDQIWPFSACGSIVDVYAPGDFVLSASNSSTTSTAIKSGTSMSTAFVTGVAAKYLQSNPTATPAQVQSYITSTATPNKIADPCVGITRPLLYNLL